MAARAIALVILVTAASGCNKVRSYLAAESWRWSASGVTETKRRGDVVCYAIDAYRTKTGKYPSRLEDLQPDFLREIPQPTVGKKKWEYELIGHGTNYWLQVFASEFGPQLGKTTTGGWEYRDDHGIRNI